MVSVSSFCRTLLWYYAVGITFASRDSNVFMWVCVDVGARVCVGVGTRVYVDVGARVCVGVGTKVCVDVGTRVSVDVGAGMFVEAANPAGISEVHPK